MFCGKCGASLPDGAKYCTRCGTVVRRQENAPSSTDITQKKLENKNTTIPSDEMMPKRKKSLLPVWIGLGVVVIFVAAFAVFWMLIGSKTQTAAEPEESVEQVEREEISEQEVEQPIENSDAVTEEEDPSTDAGDGKTQDTDSVAQSSDVEDNLQNAQGFVPSDAQNAQIANNGGYYINLRFGYKIKVPQGFQAAREADNGDGVVLYNKDLDMRITVYGSNLYTTLKERYESDKASMPGTISYDVSGETWYAMSSMDDAGQIHYCKSNAENGTLRSMVLVYPAANREACDQLTEELEKSFVSIEVEYGG